MKRTKERKLSSGPDILTVPSELSGQFRPHGSQSMTLTRPFGIMETSEFSSNLIEYHLTIRFKYTTLTLRDLSILLDVLNYQSVTFGMNLNMYLAMSEIYFRLLGNKRNSEEIKDSRIRLTVTVTEILFKILKNISFSLSSEIGIHIPDKFKKILSLGLMSKRTYGSRFGHWRPEKYLEVKIVPVDILFLERKKDSVRYSGYTKGYGESHPSAHKSKLHPNSETDGEMTRPEDFDKESYLYQRCTDPTHLLCELLYIRFRNETEEQL